MTPSDPAEARAHDAPEYGIGLSREAEAALDLLVHLMARNPEALERAGFSPEGWGQAEYLRAIEFLADALGGLIGLTVLPQGYPDWRLYVARRIAAALDPRADRASLH